MVEEWCVPSHSCEFVAAMEDVLDVYARPYDPAHPVICVDESSRQLVEHSREPLPARPGGPERWDYEYVRNGVADVFMVFEPLACERRARVTASRTRRDFAETLRFIPGETGPDAERIVLVMDNLNTHTMGSLYEATRRRRPAGSPSASRSTMSDPVFNPWDVWHVRFEFAEGKGYEYRPAIVLGRRPGGAIAMMVTGANNKLSLAHDYLIKDWRAAGLDKPSIARADRIIEISPAFVGTVGKIGELSAGDSNALALLLHRMANNGDDRP